MSEVTVFADVACPFAHVGLQRVVARLLDVGRSPSDLRVRAWPLERVNGSGTTGEALDPKVQALRRDVAPELFAGFDRARFPTTTLPALAAEAAAYRVDPGLGVRCALALREALFEHGADIGNAEVVASITGPLAVPPPTTADHDSIASDQRLGEATGVQGSPHFFTDGGDFFCPTLDVRRDDAGYHITFDQEGLARFMASLG